VRNDLAAEGIKVGEAELRAELDRAAAEGRRQLMQS